MRIIQKLSTYLNEKFDGLVLIGLLLVMIFYSAGFMLFNQYIALFYGLFSGLILVLFLKIGGLNISSTDLGWDY